MSQVIGVRRFERPAPDVFFGSTFLVIRHNLIHLVICGFLDKQEAVRMLRKKLGVKKDSSKKKKPKKEPEPDPTAPADEDEDKKKVKKKTVEDDDFDF